jgi:hypothetical protein
MSEKSHDVKVSTNLRPLIGSQIVKHLDDFVIGQTKAKRILAVAVYNHYNRTRSNVTLQQDDQQLRQELYPPTAELDDRYQGEHQHHPTIPSQQQADYYAPNANGTELVPTDRIIYDKYGRCKLKGEKSVVNIFMPLTHNFCL